MLRPSLPGLQLSPCLRNPQLLLHLLQREPFRLRIHKQHHKKLHHHHQRKKHKRIPAGLRRHQRKYQRYRRIHDPVRETPQTLPFRPHAIRKHLADEHPNHCPLRKRKKCYISNQQPHQQILIAVREENHRHSRQARRRPHRPHQQQRLPADAVDHRHRDHREQQIRRSNRHRLQVSRNLVESREGKNVVQVIENRVDPRQLIEHPDGHRQKYRERILPHKQGIVGLMLRVNRNNNVPQLALVFRLARQPQNFPRFRYALLLHQPPRAPRNPKQQQQKQQRRNRRYPQFPPPLRVSQLKRAHRIIRKIRQQNSKHDVELKQSHQPPAPFRRRNLRNVHRPQHRRSANPQPAHNPKRQQRRPVPR